MSALINGRFGSGVLNNTRLQKLTPLPSNTMVQLGCGYINQISQLANPYGSNELTVFTNFLAESGPHRQ
jgi:hypothetical protein